jgi:hypothetical protein
MNSEVRWIPENAAEELAQRVLEAHLGCELVGVPPAETPTVECRTPEGAKAFEVKQLTSEEYLALSNASNREQTSWDSDVLRWRWDGVLTAPSLSDLYSPVPRFADDPPPDVMAEYEAIGLKVKSRAEREDEHRRRHPGPKRPSVRIRGLGPDIEEHLHMLEDHDVRSTRSSGAYDVSPVGRALWAIAVRTSHAIFLGQEPPAGMSPGIDVHVGFGYHRTGDPDTVVSRIERWLESDRSTNLRDSLRNETSGVERHAVLVLDPAMEPEYWAAVEAPEAFCPTRAPFLPDEVDVLWFILGPAACVYRDGVGWEAFATPDA